MEPEPEPEPEPQPQPQPQPQPEPEPEPEQEREPEADDRSWEDGYDDEDDGVAADAEYEDDDDVDYDDDDDDDDDYEGGAAAADQEGGRAVEDTWSSDSGTERSDFDGDSGAVDAAERSSDRWSRHAADGPEPPASLCCPITLTLLSDPVTTADGHTYERSALTEWFDRGHRSSPVTRKRLTSREMHTNFLARQAVDTYQQKITGTDSPAKPSPPSRGETLACVDRFEDERSVDTDEIRRRNRRTRRAAAWDEQINHIENWIATVDPASGQTYYYNRLTRVTQWEDPALDHTGKVGSAVSAEAMSTTTRPVAATHPGMAAFPGMKPAENERHGAVAGKGRAYGLCVWFSAVILVRGDSIHCSLDLAVYASR
jgi:hypothetical protein